MSDSEHPFIKWRRISDDWNQPAKTDRQWPVLTPLQACGLVLSVAEVNNWPSEKLEEEFEAIRDHLAKASNGV